MIAGVNRAALFCLEDSACTRALQLAEKLPTAERSCFPTIPVDEGRPLMVSDVHGTVTLFDVYEWAPGELLDTEAGPVELFRKLKVMVHYGGRSEPAFGGEQIDVVMVGTVIMTAAFAEGAQVLDSRGRGALPMTEERMRSFVVDGDINFSQKAEGGVWEGQTIGSFVQGRSLTKEDRETLSPKEVAAHYLEYCKGDFVGAVSTFLDELHYIDLPRHYIIERTPRHVANNPEKFKKREAKRIARIQDRSRWVVMDPEDIRRVWPSGVPKGGHHAPPVPHFRRGHEKLLAGDRWTLKRGQVIRVRPSWVGGREWDDGAAKYKVISRQGASIDQA